MRRQRNRSQMKEQEKSPEELNEMEASKLPDTEFKTMVIRMLKELRTSTAREKWLVTYSGVPRRLSVDFSKETLQTGRDWHKIFKVVKS